MNIRFAWRQNDLYEAELTPDEVREVFGLGGTPDGELLGRVNLLLTHPRYQVLSQQFQEKVRDLGGFEAPGDSGPMSTGLAASPEV